MFQWADRRFRNFVGLDKIFPVPPVAKFPMNDGLLRIIPGYFDLLHGGLTDRFNKHDCLPLRLTFYYHSAVRGVLAPNILALSLKPACSSLSINFGRKPVGISCPPPLWLGPIPW